MNNRITPLDGRATKDTAPLELKTDVDALLQRLRALRGRMPADFKFDRADASARWV
jgi:hypothetical protein